MNFSSFFRSILCGVVGFIAELEFSLLGKFDRKFNIVRRLYLRMMGINSTSDLSCGKEVYFRYPGNVSIGRRVSIGSFSRFWNYEKVTIGNDFLSAGALTVNTGGHDKDSLEPINQPVVIGDRVWVGVNVTILGGVDIGSDVIIGAGSLVNKSIPPYSIVAGVPAKVIGKVNKKVRSESLWTPFK